MHKSTSILSYLNVDLFKSEKQSLDKRYQDSENSFRSIFEKSPSGNLIISKDLIILQANQAFINLLGLYQVSQVVGTSILQYAHPDYTADWLLLQQSIWVQQASSFTIETCMNKNGAGMWCELTSIVYQDGDTVLGYTIIEDISKRKKDEDLIKSAKANLMTILNNTESGYVLYNRKLQIVTFNALAKKFAGLLYSKELEEGTYLLDYFPADRHGPLLDITQRVMAGENIAYERAITNEEGEERWMEAKWINVKDAEDKSWGFILSSKDITESKLAAIEREKITLELIQRNKALEQFTNITSHNLRAPVANIIGLAELIEEMPMDEDEKKEMMDGILLSAKNLDMVINDINEILQVKELLNETKEKIDLQHLVNDIKVSISNMIHKENVSIQCDFDGAEVIYSVRSYLYSIFYNMILNSIKYRRLDTQPQLILSAKANDGKIQLVFKDNGKGIDMPRHGGNLFGLYKRFDTSVQGKGLGLFMVKTQIESLHGTIDVKSELGHGTEFIVELPAA